MLGNSPIAAQPLGGNSGGNIYYVSIGGVVTDGIRETMSGDTRITEDGDTRVIDGDFQPWSGIGSIDLATSLTVWEGDPRIKHEGSWKPFLPYVKYNGEWVVPRYIYVKENDVWSRVY